MAILFIPLIKDIMDKQSEAIIHTILDSEKEAFTNHVNEVLKNDPELKNVLPVPASQIFDAMHDGTIFCKIINEAVNSKVPPISPAAINNPTTNTYQKIQNLNLAIESARSIGCMVVNIRPEFIMEKRQHIVLGLIWQIIKIHISNRLNLKRHPEIIMLKKEDEEPELMMKLGYEEILIRWLNYHIKKNGGTKQVKNLGKDLSDSQAYGHVLTNISNMDKSFWEKDEHGKASQVIEQCHHEHIQTTVKPQDILSGNQRLNTLLCVDIFNQKHGLVIPVDKPVEIPQEPETDESREIRVFKNWINSQGIEGVYVNYLMEDLRDGTILLKLIDHIRPGSVDWKKYSNKLHSRIHIVQNCNYAVDLSGEKFNVVLVNIAGVDIVDGKPTLTLGLVWQLYKQYWEQRVGKIEDDRLVKWGNEKVSPNEQIKNFKDKSLSNCQYFLKIIDSIKPKTVDFSKVREVQSEEDTIANINYTIASARKMGAQVMTLWEHIHEVNPKFIAILMAELEHIQKQHK